MVNPIIRKEERLANRGEESRRKHHQNWGPVYNMAVPKFDGDGCWQQHLQIFNAIEKSNGWADETAALQLYDVSGGARQPGGTLLLFTGKVGGVQKKIRECNSPNRSRSCHVRHGVGDFSGPGVRRYGYLRPKPDGPGQVSYGPTELWAATSPRQVFLRIRRSGR